jgi:hypothetical protein
MLFEELNARQEAPNGPGGRWGSPGVEVETSGPPTTHAKIKPVFCLHPGAVEKSMRADRLQNWPPPGTNIALSVWHVAVNEAFAESPPHRGARDLPVPIGDKSCLSCRAIKAAVLAAGWMRKGRPADGLFLLDRGDGRGDSPCASPKLKSERPQPKNNK